MMVEIDAVEQTHAAKADDEHGDTQELE